MNSLLSVSCGRILSLLACLLLASNSFGQQPDEADQGVTVERVVDKGLTRIKIPAQDGKVAWEDVLRALLRVGHMEDNALKDKFPSGALDLERAYSRYSLMAINLAMSPDIRMEIVAKTESTPAHLLVTVNEDAIQERKRRLSKKMRDRITGGELREGKFGLRLVQDWDDADPQQALVIVVHGFNSSPERFEPLAEAFRQAGLLSATYSYPDDQPIADSARQLSTDLKKLYIDHPKRPIHLVTHSMGGLVSRCVIEQPDLNPGNVTKLIMIAPPSHGSLLANFAFGIDILDHATSGSDSRRCNSVLRSGGRRTLGSQRRLETQLTLIEETQCLFAQCEGELHDLSGHRRPFGSGASQPVARGSTNGLRQQHSRRSVRSSS